MKKIANYFMLTAIIVMSCFFVSTSAFSSGLKGSSGPKVDVHVETPAKIESSLAYRPDISVKTPYSESPQVITQGKTIGSSSVTIASPSASAPTIRTTQPNIDINSKIDITSSKSLTDQAKELVPKNNGKSRVTMRSPSQKVEVDLDGKSHSGVQTPHTKLSPRNLNAPRQPAYNTKKATVKEATQKDIRTVRRYLDNKKR